MKNSADGQLLRVFIGELDQWQGRPLYEMIVELARKEQMAGATVIRGCMGFGRKSLVHTTKILRLSEDLPMIVEIVDRAEKINQFLPKLDGMIKEGLVTIEKANVVIYRPD